MKLIKLTAHFNDGTRDTSVYVNADRIVHLYRRPEVDYTVVDTAEYHSVKVCETVEEIVRMLAYESPTEYTVVERSVFKDIDWTPVSEKVPEFSGVYLVTIHEPIGDYVWLRLWDSGKKVWSECDGVRAIYDRCYVINKKTGEKVEYKEPEGEVTAWMQMPRSYMRL